MSSMIRTAESFFQNMVVLLTNQNDFWQKEHETLRCENEEIKKLLEELEGESQLKSLVVSIERRFIDALKEQKNCGQKPINPALFITNSEFAKRKRQWNIERKALINVIRNLKIKIQVLHFTGIQNYLENQGQQKNYKQNNFP